MQSIIKSNTHTNEGFIMAEQKPTPNAGGAGFIKLPTTKIKKPAK